MTIAVIHGGPPAFPDFSPGLARRGGLGAGGDRMGVGPEMETRQMPEGALAAVRGVEVMADHDVVYFHSLDYVVEAAEGVKDLLLEVMEEVQDVPVGAGGADVLQEDGRQLEALVEFQHGGDGGQGNIVHIAFLGEKGRNREPQLPAFPHQRVHMGGLLALAQELAQIVDLVFQGFVLLHFSPPRLIVILNYVSLLFAFRGPPITLPYSPLFLLVVC